MSVRRTGDRLLRLYPPQWRERYGEELAELIAEAGGDRRVPWRVRLDVARAAGRERLLAAGLSGDGAPGDQVRGGALLVLCAWALFAVGGVAVQKFSEHWQGVTPPADRGLPAAAFATLVVLAICAAVLVLAGIACAVPSLGRFLRGGGWAEIRRRVVVAALATGVAIAALVTLVVSARGLTADQRAGHDVAYTGVFVASALLAVACLIAWTVAAVTTARRLSLPAPTLRAEAYLASAVTVLMALMTAATTVWWVALAEAAPWFLAGRSAGTGGSPIAPQLVIAAALMVTAVLLGAAGARQTRRGLRAIAGPA
jgi:MFS family permease